MEIISSPLPGLFLISYDVHRDSRGIFEKAYSRSAYSALSLCFSPVECFTSRSSKNVLRGMHYTDSREPPSKLVYCINGSALDVVVDIDPQSPSFNRPYSITLSQNKNVALLITGRYAHGFLALEDDTIISYHVDSDYIPSMDCGILWSSIDFCWPVVSPILSLRDQRHPNI